MMLETWECRECGQVWRMVEPEGVYVPTVEAAMNSGCEHPKGLQGTLNAGDAILLGILMEKGT